MYQQEGEPWVNPPVSLFAEFNDAVEPDEKKEEEQQHEEKEQEKRHPYWTWWGGTLGTALVHNAFKTSPKRPKHRHSGAGLL